MPSAEPKNYSYLIDYLNREDFIVVGAAQNPPSREEIKKFETLIDYSLPESFVAFSCSSLGGLYVEAKDEVWPKPRIGDVGPAWHFAYGVMVFGFSENIPDWLDIRKKTEAFRQETGTTYIPFLKVTTDPDVYCFSGDGKIYRWNHETNEFNLIDKSFLDLLDEELRALNERKEQRLKQVNS